MKNRDFPHELESLFQWPLAYCLFPNNIETVFVTNFQLTRSRRPLPAHVPARGLFLSPVNDCSKDPAFWCTSVSPDYRPLGLISNNQSAVLSTNRHPVPLYMGHWVNDTYHDQPSD